MSGMTCDPPGVRAAVAVRRLGHELVNHRPDATVLDRVAAVAEDLATAVAVRRLTWHQDPGAGPQGFAPSVHGQQMEGNRYGRL